MNTKFTLIIWIYIYFLTQILNKNILLSHMYDIYKTDHEKPQQIPKN